MSPTATIPHSLDFTKHLSDQTAARTASQGKALGFLSSQPGMISLAGGKPSASLFPLNSATFRVPARSELSSAGGLSEAWKQKNGEELEFSLFRGKEGGAVDLERGLQYSGGPNGFPELLRPLEQITSLVHAPPYKDWTVVLTLGCSDGINKVFTLFANQGRSNVLAERQTFGNTLVIARQSHGITFWPVEIDDDGIVPESLDEVMTGWDEKKQGDRPRVLYTIPCGQNPTGTVPTEERYNQIYALAQKHDLIIMEDDPYFWLQFQPYTPDLPVRQAQLDAHPLPALSPTSEPDDEDLHALAEAFNGFAGVRSHLSRDVDGRVVRLDTFSKIFAPGLRAGWVTCNEKFAERLYRITETSTQPLSCLTQSVLASYLSPVHGWGVGGFLRWIAGVRLEYQSKRDHFLDSIGSFVPPEYATTNAPRGGMFGWIRINLEKHPRFVSTTSSNNTSTLMEEIFNALVAQNLVVYPGQQFTIESPGSEVPFFRLTFAGEREETEKGIEIFGRVVRTFFEEGPEGEVAV